MVRPGDARGDSGPVAAGLDDLRAGATSAGPRCLLRTRPPLETPRQLGLATSLEDITALLTGPAAVATWFSVTREPAGPEGRVAVGLPDTTTVLHGRETWVADQHALWFDGDHSVVSAYVSLRSAILSVAGFGADVWIHLGRPPGRDGSHPLTTLERVVDQGLARLRAELTRTP